LLRGLPPPLSLVWFDAATGETHIQNDGLGYAQRFGFEGGRVLGVE